MTCPHLFAAIGIGLTLFGVDTLTMAWRAQRREVAMALVLSASGIFLSIASIALVLLP